MQINASFNDYDDVTLTQSSFMSMSVKAFLNPLTLYPFPRPSLHSKHFTQFKRLQFFPIPVRYCVNGVVSKKANGAMRRQAAVHAPHRVNKSLYPSQWLTQRLLKPLKWLVASKKMVAVLGISIPVAYVASTVEFSGKNSASTLALPAPKMATFDSIMAQKQLRLATVSGSTTYFAEDGFEHGFGYDVVRNYAERLNVTLNTQVYASEAAALAAVKAGQADMALTNVADQQPLSTDALSTVSLTCDRDYLSAQGLNRNISVQVNPDDAKLNADMKNFLCGGQALTTNQHLAAFYNQTVLADSFNQDHFVETMTQVLPRYESSFKQMANRYGLDWELLVAMGYQESHLDAQATSPTGVRGIMMLTNATADAMGVDNRIDATQSIQGGAKYLSLLQQEFAQVPASDRVWFMLAAYNMGPQAIKDIQQTLEKRGRDGNDWAAVYQYLNVNSQSNSRYVQCLNYVTHIRSYLEALKLDKVHTRQLT